MREKHKRGGKTAFVPIKVMLSDPGRVEAVSLRVNDLLRSEAIPLSRGRLIEKPSEETESSWTSPRHANRATSAVVERAKRRRDVRPRAGSIIRRSEELILRARQSQILSQSLALIFAPEQSSPLQLRNHLVDEVLEAFRHVGEHDVEAIATLLEKPLLHFVGDGGRGADEHESAEAACDLGELSHRAVFALGERDEA
jgi:hypothetical protein